MSGFLAGGLERLREIDCSEDVVTHCRQVGRRLVSRRVDDAVPNFFDEGDFRSLTELVETVSRPYRGRGVAGALMDEMEQLARDEGARALYL